MKAVIQRVRHASVQVEGETVGRCGEGLMILLGVAEGDTEADAELLCRKIVNLRIFTDEAGKMNRSIKDIDGVEVQVTFTDNYGGLIRISYTRNLAVFDFCTHEFDCLIKLILGDFELHRFSVAVHIAIKPSLEIECIGYTGTGRMMIFCLD